LGYLHIKAVYVPEIYGGRGLAFMIFTQKSSKYIGNLLWEKAVIANEMCARF